MLIAGSVIMMVIAVMRGVPQPPPKPAKVRAHERPWLTHEAMQELVSPGGGPGPLFASLTLGGTPPNAEIRHGIEAFALENAIEIRFEVADHELKAIRVGVAFGGCCGYEGTDTFGRLLHRTRVYDDCEDCRGTPATDWSAASDDGVSIHGHVEVNRIEVRWEAMLELSEVLDRAEAIAGRPRAMVRAHAGDHWRERKTEQVFDVPFVFSPNSEDNDHSLHLAIEHGRIAEVSFTVRGQNSETVGEMLRKRWGRPHVADHVWTWQTPERVITFTGEGYDTTFVIRANAPATTTALARAAATPAPRS
jgi:hypothetical protein